jgi:hypothetical protein
VLLVARALTKPRYHQCRPTQRLSAAIRQAKARTIYDILNEPDARGLGWDRIKDIYLDTMDAVNAVNSQVQLRLFVP